MESIKKHIASSCGFSEEMESYLLGDELSEFKIIEIILGAPIPLTQKRALLESMDTPDSKITSDVSDCILEIDKALDALELKDGELFTLTECWYDDDFLDENKSSGEPFFSFQALLRYVNKMVEEETEDLEEGEEYTCWTKATKWVANGDGTATRVYTYTFVGNEICYFWRVSENRHYCFKGYVSSIELNLSIPFQVGDIVTLDCLPFAPVKRAVTIEITANYDCCGVRILYRLQREINGNYEWAEGALKHGHGWNRYYPLLSPLYRLSSFTGELPPEEQLMLVVQRFVRQAPENGIKLEKFVSKSKPDDNELSEYLKREQLNE